MKKALFLYSGYTGAGNQRKRIRKASLRLSRVFDLTVVETSNLEELKEASLKACSSFDVLIVAGGDGTFHRVINVVAREDKRPILGFLNAGTMGDVSANFSLPHSFRKGVKAIEKGRVQEFDLCQANDVYFAYMAACGAYSDVSYTAERKKKRRFGKLAYYSLSLKEAFHRRKVSLRIQTKEGEIHYEGPFFLAMNGSRVGGFYVNRKGKPNDGVFEAMLTPKGPFNGLLHYLGPKGRWTIETEGMALSSDEEIPWCLDGEKYLFTHLDLRICPSKIKVFCWEK